MEFAVFLNNLSQLLPERECCKIAQQHLESCSQKIRGYWDSKNDFYEEIVFVNSPVVELVGRAVGIDRVEEQIIPWIIAKFFPQSRWRSRLGY